MNWLRNSKKKNYKCFTFFRKMTNEFILPWKPHIVAITRTDSKCYQKAILQLYHLFPWQRNLIKPNKRWHAFFFTYQSLSNCKVWKNIWLSVATEFLFLHINDLNCLLLFFFNSDEYVLYHWKKRRYQSSYGNSYSISTIFRDKIILIIFSKAINLDILNLHTNEANMHIHIFVCAYYLFCFRLYKGFGTNSQYII